MYSEFFDILSFVLTSQPVSRASVWEHFGMAAYRQTDDAIEELLSRGLLRRRRASSPHLDELTVSALGREQLDAERKHCAAAAKQECDKQTAEAKRLQERHEDYANEERRHRTQNQIAIVMPLITFVLGLLVEHFFQIVVFLFAVFH